jgi:hypothetical protein
MLRLMPLVSHLTHTPHHTHGYISLQPHCITICLSLTHSTQHASGTYDKESGTGGSDGATMRFEPEATDGANAGLSIIRDMLHPVQMNHPDLSAADLWTSGE